MDTRSHRRFAWLLAVALAGAGSLDDFGAIARHGFRVVTHLICVAAPARAAAATITTGVRG